MKYNRLKSGARDAVKGVDMADMNGHGEPGVIWEMIKNSWAYIASVLLAIFAWLGKRQVSRIDDLDHRLDKAEQTYISRDEHNRTIEALRSDIKESAAGTHKRLDQLLFNLTKDKNR